VLLEVEELGASVALVLSLFCCKYSHLFLSFFFSYFISALSFSFHLHPFVSSLMYTNTTHILFLSLSYMCPSSFTLSPQLPKKEEAFR
jgi:hypothetical protein